MEGPGTCESLVHQPWPTLLTVSGSSQRGRVTKASSVTAAVCLWVPVYCTFQGLIPCLGRGQSWWVQRT